MREAEISGGKGGTGHLLGASGAVEAISTIMAIREGIIPPTRNADNLMPEAEGMNIVRGEARRTKTKTGVNNSFGFGGVNSVIVFERYE